MNSAIIVAAGMGRRMRLEPEVDKLFLDLEGRPVIAHAWQRFDSTQCIDEIILVVRDESREKFLKLPAKFGFRKPFQLVVGGKERQDSVWNGLQAVSEKCELVAIHDGARPCISVELIEQTLAAARETGAAVAAQRVTDTIKQSKDGRLISGHNLERDLLWAVQTPQTFRVDVIRRALTAVRESGQLVTDDTAACEFIGQPVRLVESAGANPKVTVAKDLPYIAHLIRTQTR